MPLIIDEADELTHWNKERHAERTLSLLKNQTTMIAPRTILTKESDEITGYSLSVHVITHNGDKIDEDGFLKHSTSIQHTAADKKSNLQINQFEDFMQNQELLKEKWNIIAERYWMHSIHSPILSARHGLTV